MNIRFPDSLPAKPSAARTAPGGIQATSMRFRIIVGIVGALILAFIAWRIFSVPSPPARPAPPVVTATVMRRDMAVVEHTIGTVVANATVQVTARVQGQLMRANFREGQLVHAGDLLFEIDPRPYQATYDSAMASLITAKAKAERYARLKAQNAISPQDADDARAAYLEAEAAVESARLNLGYTTIRSPIDGKTGPILIQPGNLVTANGTNPLVVITQIQPVKLSFSLPQSELPRLQERARQNDLSAAVANHGSVTRLVSAPIDFIGNEVDDKTGTIELRATFANTDSALVPGQLVDVVVTLNAIQNAIVVPREAVNLGPNMRYVYVIKDGIAQMRPVTVIYDDGTDMAVKGQIKPGDKVITDGQLRVLPGKPVKITQPVPGTGTRDPTLVQ
jgi:membrane fusion protein, multidrug efflux system